MTSVVLADDEALVREGLATLLAARGIDILAVADNGRQAIEGTRKHRPDVLVMDIRMPQMDGISATRSLAESGDPTPVLILTTYDLDQYVYAALKAGASGFILKSSPIDRLVEAIAVVAAGEALLAPELTRRLIAQYVAEGNNPDQPGRLIQWLYPRTDVYTWRVPGTWYDIGSAETLREADEIFSRS